MGTMTLEAQAHTIERTYTDATPDYAPELEWFGMTLDRESESQQFVMEAERYIDRDGLDALREAGYSIEYIEAHYHDEYDDEPVVSIALPVLEGGDE